MRELIKFIASFGYAGCVPLIPGTIGSLCGLAVYVSVKDSFYLSAGVFLCLAGLGFAVCAKAERIFGKKDAPQIVIDEVCGMMLCFMLVPFSVLNLALGFVFFRIMDIVKPFPAKRLERIAGSAGIMLDDISAAVYAGLILQGIDGFILPRFL